jgi:hypothetical protein
LLPFSVLFSPQSPLFHSLLYSSLSKFILLSFVLSFPPLFLLFFVLSIFVHFFFSRPLPSPSLPLFFFSFFRFPSSSLSLGIYKEEKGGERVTTPIQSWYWGRGWSGGHWAVPNWLSDFNIYAIKLLI